MTSIFCRGLCNAGNLYSDDYTYVEKGYLAGQTTVDVVNGVMLLETGYNIGTAGVKYVGSIFATTGDEAARIAGTVGSASGGVVKAVGSAESATDDVVRAVGSGVDDTGKISQLEDDFVSRGSTGRTTPSNLNEQLAMEEAMSNPSAGKKIENIVMNDPRWPASEGWVKMTTNSDLHGYQIHYVYNEITGAVDDFKFVK